MILTFIKPAQLILFVLIPLAILIHFITLKRKRVNALKFANFDAIARVKGVDLISKNVISLFITMIIILLLVLTLAGTSYNRTIPASSFSFVIAIDASQSMEATDLSPNRLEAAKQTAKSFIDSSPPGTKMAIVSFSGNAFIEQSLTADKTLLRSALDRVPLSSIGGTDLSEAVITGTNLLKGEDAKALVLISDGRLNVGTVDEAINYAGDHTVLVHTIAIGTEEGGETSYGLSIADEDALKALAYNTEGEFFRATDQEEFEESFNQIRGIELRRVAFDITSYLVIAALTLVILEYILVNTRFRVLP